jgi:flavorubredoxin
MRLFKSAFILSALLLLFGASELAAQTRKGMEKGLYVVTGRVINGNLIPNFGLNLGDIVEISDDGSTMTVLKSGKRFPVKPEEPNLQSADERLKQLNLKVVEGLKVRFKPAEADRQAAFAFGKAFAERILGLAE